MVTETSRETPEKWTAGYMSLGIRQAVQARGVNLKVICREIYRDICKKYLTLRLCSSSTKAAYVHYSLSLPLTVTENTG